MLGAVRTRRKCTVCDLLPLFPEDYQRWGCSPEATFGEQALQGDAGRFRVFLRSIHSDPIRTGSTTDVVRAPQPGKTLQWKTRELRNDRTRFWAVRVLKIVVLGIHEPGLLVASSAVHIATRSGVGWIMCGEVLRLFCWPAG